MSTAWVTFWLWICGGYASAEIAMLLGTIVIGICLTFVPLSLLIDKKVKHYGVHGTLYACLVLATMSGGIVLLTANNLFNDLRSNFQRCIQTAQLVERSSGNVTLYTVHCSSRDHIDDEWSGFTERRVSLEPMTRGMVSSLIDIPSGK